MDADIANDEDLEGFRQRLDQLLTEEYLMDRSMWSDPVQEDPLMHLRRRLEGQAGGLAEELR
jgi:hypothetical protein